VEVGEPGPGEVRIRHHAIGLNFIDVYQRTGLYPFPCRCSSAWKARRGRGGGRGRDAPAAGDRAAYASQPAGSYSECA
jgi:NADPH2:quinone reductase